MGIAQLVEWLTEKLIAILTRVRVPRAARDFSLPELTANADYKSSRCPYSSHVQSHTSTSVLALKIASTPPPPPPTHTPPESEARDVFLLLIDDRLCSAILRSLEQTHCARLWFYMSD